MAMVESAGETSEISGTVATTTVEDLMTGTGDEVRSGYDANDYTGMVLNWAFT